MAKTNFHHLAIRNEIKEELDKLKEQLTNNGITKVTDNEIMNLLLQKNKRVKLNEKEIQDAFKKFRGIC